MSRLRDFVFRLYEQPRLRNSFYTAAFLIFVPVGLRFAWVVWEYGAWFDKPLAVLAGLLIGLTTVVTLMRFWQVPPKQVVTEAPPAPVAAPPELPPVDVLAAARRRAAENRALALGASALGSTRGRHW